MPGPEDLHVTRSGPDDEPGAVVVVHGGLDRSSSFGRMARRLRDVPMIRYDRRGYGRSAHLAAAPLPVHVDDLLALASPGPCVVFGHSVGGVIALAAAQRRPDVVRAVLAYEPPLPWLGWWPRSPGGQTDPADEAEAFMRRMVGDRIWERLPPATRQARRDEGVALRADIDSLESGPPAFDASQVSVPVLVALGSETVWWHRRGSEELAAALPQAELAVVQGAGHGVHLSHPSHAAKLVTRLRAMGHSAHSGR